MMKNIMYLFVLVSLVLTSCGSDSEKAVQEDVKTDVVSNSDIDFNALAKDVCECMYPVVGVIETVNKIKASGDIGALEKFAESSQSTLKGSDACFKGLESTYGKIDNIKDEAFSNALVNTCPKVANLIAQAKQNLNTQAK